jgi:hypothetical protein
MATTSHRLVSSPLSEYPVYLCQPAIDRPGWLDRAVGLQLRWAEVWGEAGISSCCQLLVGHDVRTARPVPLFRYLEAPRREEIAQVRREQPQAGLLVQTRIWSASACGDEPWGEARLVRIDVHPVEICRIIGGGSTARWQRWASLVTREVGRVVGGEMSEARGARREVSVPAPAISVPGLSRAGRAALRAHGLYGDPVWVGLLDQPSSSNQAERRPWSADLNVGVETLSRRSCGVEPLVAGTAGCCGRDKVCHAPQA